MTTISVAKGKYKRKIPRMKENYKKVMKKVDTRKTNYKAGLKRFLEGAEPADWIVEEYGTGIKTAPEAYEKVMVPELAEKWEGRVKEKIATVTAA